MARTKAEYTRWNQSYKGMYSKLKFRAKEFKRPMELTFEEFVAIRQNPCKYCLQPLPICGYRVDRIDNSLGYTVANSVPCCGKCNKAKSNLSEWEFLDLVRCIYENNIMRTMPDYEDF